MGTGIAVRRVEVFCAGRSHPGMQRKDNQDQFLIAQLARTLRVKETSLGSDWPGELTGQPQGTLLIVADGVGGVRGGEHASQLVVRTISRRMLDLAPLHETEGDEERLAEGLHAAVLEARDALRAEGEERPEYRDMGSTLTLAWLLWPRLHLVHVGDSRCYLLRDGHLTQLTRDHTVARRLVENGVLSPEDEARSPYSSVLWNAVSGKRTKLEPQLSTHELESGDVLLLCTDGLTRHVPDQEIAGLLEQRSPAAACEVLVRAANDQGGSDNTTVVVARVQEREETPPTGRPRPRRSGSTGRLGAGPL